MNIIIITFLLSSHITEQFLWFLQTFCKKITPQYRQNKTVSLPLVLFFAGREGKDLKKRLLIIYISSNGRLLKIRRI